MKKSQILVYSCFLLTDFESNTEVFDLQWTELRNERMETDRGIERVIKSEMSEVCLPVSRRLDRITAALMKSMMK